MPTDASAAVSDTLAQDHRARDMAQVAVFAALIAALTLVPGVPLIGSSVPFTLQTLGVTLAGAVLGPRKGALAVLVYLAMIAVGLPVASGYKGGLGVLTGPTGGYLVGFVLAAAVVGFLSRLVLRRAQGAKATGGLLLACLAGIPVVYAVESRGWLPSPVCRSAGLCRSAPWSSSSATSSRRLSLRSSRARLPGPCPSCSAERLFRGRVCRG